MRALERVGDAAAALHRARLERRPIAPLAPAWPELDEPTAYAVQRATAELRAEPVVGFKLGYTSAAMREQMKVDTPNYGALFAATRVDAEGFIDAPTLIHPLVEPEIAVVVGRELADEQPSRERVFAALDAVMPALEVVDTRYERYAFSAVDNIADNSSAARFVLGPPRAPGALGDLRAIPALLWCNGRSVARGVGADVMGDPLLALAWFLGRRAREGRPVPAGSIVLTGGMTAAAPAPLGSAFVAEFGPLGIVKAYFG